MSQSVVSSSHSIALKIAQFASDKKAMDIVVLDMREVVNFCDFFVICSGNTDRQVRAITEYIKDSLLELGVRPGSCAGIKKSDWVVFDAGDVVTHIFQSKVRQFYNLEYLWREAKVETLNLEDPPNPTVSS